MELRILSIFSFSCRNLKLKYFLFSLFDDCLSGEDWVGELVAVIASAKQPGEQLRVRLGDDIQCYMGAKSQTIIIQQDSSTNLPDFRKSKTGFVFTSP